MNAVMRSFSRHSAAISRACSRVSMKEPGRSVSGARREYTSSSAPGQEAKRAFAPTSRWLMLMPCH